MPEPIVEVVQTERGRVISHTGHRSRNKRIIAVDRVWAVSVDGVLVGTIEYRLITRERRVTNRMYVESRWESPGWMYSTPGADRGLEAPSKAAAVEQLTYDILRAPTRHAPNTDL